MYGGGGGEKCVCGGGGGGGGGEVGVGLIPKCSAGWAVDVRDYTVLFTWPRATRATTSGGPY